MRIPLKQSTPQQNLKPDDVRNIKDLYRTTREGRVQDVEHLFRLIRDQNQQGVGDVLKSIGEAETKRGDDMVKYCKAATEFYREMKEL